MDIISKITTPIKKLKKKPGLLIVGVVIDALFFILYGFLTSPFFKSMENSLLVISDKVSLELDLISQGQSAKGGMIDIIFSAPVLSDVISFVLTGIVVVVIIYLLYSTLHGINWKYAKQISDGHKSKYLKQFFKVNILWFVLLTFHAILDILQELRYKLISRVIGEGINYLRYFMLLLMVLLVYFMLISYKNGSLKKVFSSGIKDKQSLISFGILIVLFVIINYVLILTSNLNLSLGFFDANLGFILGLVLFLPAITYSRVLFLESAKKS